MVPAYMSLAFTFVFVRLVDMQINLRLPSAIFLVVIAQYGFLYSAIAGSLRVRAAEAASSRAPMTCVMHARHTINTRMCMGFRGQDYREILRSGL